VFRILPAALNGELGFAECCREPPGAPYRALAFTIARLDASGTAIVEKVSFVEPELLVRTGFPRVLD